MIRLRCPRPPARHLTFSPDGDLLAAIGPSVVWCWFRSRGWELTGVYTSGYASGLAFHPGGGFLAYAGRPPTETGRPHPPTAPPLGPPGVWFYPLAAGGAVEPAALPLHLGDPPNLTEVAPTPHLAFTPDGLTLLGNTTVTPSFFSRARPCVLHWHLAPAPGGWRVLDASPGLTQADAGAALVGGTLVLVAEYGVATCPLDPTETAPLVVPPVGGRCVAASPAAEVVAVAGDQWLTFWHLRTPHRLGRFRLRPRDGLVALAFAPGGAAVAVGTADGVTVCDPRTGAAGPTFDFGVGPVESVAYSPDGQLMAVAGKRGVVVADVD